MLMISLFSDLCEWVAEWKSNSWQTTTTTILTSRNYWGRWRWHYKQQHAGIYYLDHHNHQYCAALLSYNNIVVIISSSRSSSITGRRWWCCLFRTLCTVSTRQLTEPPASSEQYPGVVSRCGRKRGIWKDDQYASDRRRCFVDWYTNISRRG